MITEQYKNYLITTSDWFFGPDGEQYKAVYGPASLCKAKDLLGFVPRRSADWFVSVGTHDKHIHIAGCQIHYAIRTDDRPMQILSTYVDKDTGRHMPINKILYLE
jgi:hypothetical protein